MELVFALITYLGVNMVDTSYFKDIDSCFYFAERINRNASVPRVESKVRYTAVCQPKKINIKKEKVY